jgi:hypothetical protein
MTYFQEISLKAEDGTVRHFRAPVDGGYVEEECVRVGGPVIRQIFTRGRTGAAITVGAGEIERVVRRWLRQVEQPARQHETVSVYSPTA